LQDQQVAVVGGTSGMGLGIARAALDAGAAVVIAGRRPVATRAELGSDRVRHEVVDVTDEAAVRALFEGLPALDHVVVTAAPPPGSWQPLLAGDAAAYLRYLDDKLRGSLGVARWAAPKLRPGGTITFLTGAAAARPRTGIVSVAFTAVEALCRTLAFELAPLRVNTIRPGVVDSEMWSFLDGSARQAVFDRARTAFPARRIGTPADIAGAAMFLMTNPYVTGSVLEVTGGEQLVDAL
jgi:NAD(P)-dependent dehydrogenase (short-subunit alcohol dehydrogenase family)